MESWDDFVEQFLVEHLRARPPLAVWAGRHEFDGRLPDWSADGLEDELRRLRSALRTARAFPEPEDPDGRLEREHLISELEREIFWRGSCRWPFRNPRFYLDDLHPQVYVSRPYAPLAERMEAFTTYAEAIPEATRRIAENLSGPLPATYRSLGARGFGGLAEFYRRDAVAAFESGEDSRLRRRFEEAVEAAARAMDGLRETIAAGDGTDPSESDADFRLGEERLRELLRVRDGVVLSLDDLVAAVREDLEENRRRLESAVARHAEGTGIEECLGELQRAADPTPVESAREHARRLESFVRERELATIPEASEIRVTESPPYLRWNAAAIEIPGPEDADLPALFYLCPPDPEWSEEERSEFLPDPGALVFITAHEVWPGHYLQFRHAHRAPSPVARLLLNPSFVEGWAHYAEELCWEAGYAEGDPAAEVCLRVNALLRDVRCLAAVELHAGEASVEDAADMFRDLACQDPATARQQAARGTFDPGYMSYTLGKLMIRKLREDWRARNDDLPLKEFHDRLLSRGAPPIPTVRRHVFPELDGEAL